MSRLILVISDLHLARFSEAARRSLPRLPRLEQWLARAERTRAGGWRPYVQRTVLEGERRSVPPASIAAAAATNVPATLPVWFATPVHLVAGLDTVRVHPAGVLRLSTDEQRTLELDFARVFSGSGWSLHATGRRELLLAGGVPVSSAAVQSHDPLLWLGADPRAGLPAGPGADPLRRLGAEMEMWLHEHPVNRQRMARGHLSVSAFWIWGGGASAIAPGARAAGKPTGHLAWGEDLYLDGVGRLSGYAVAPLPEQWPPRVSAPDAPGADRLVVCELGATPAAGSLESLDAKWIGPAFEFWRAGGVQRATLLAGDYAMSLERTPVRALWRRFRRARPWWESLAPC